MRKQKTIGRRWVGVKKIFHYFYYTYRSYNTYIHTYYTYTYTWSDYLLFLPPPLLRRLPFPPLGFAVDLVLPAPLPLLPVNIVRFLPLLLGFGFCFSCDLLQKKYNEQYIHECIHGNESTKQVYRVTSWIWIWKEHNVLEESPRAESSVLKTGWTSNGSRFIMFFTLYSMYKI